MSNNTNATNTGRSGKLKTAGSLMLFAGVFNIVWLVMAFTGIYDIKALLRSTVWITPFPYLTLDIGFGGNTVLASIIVLIFILGIIFSITGGIFALRRRAWSLAIAGATGAIICIPVAGIAAVILTLMSKRQFAGRGGT